MLAVLAVRVRMLVVLAMRMRVLAVRVLVALVLAVLVRMLAVRMLAVRVLAVLVRMLTVRVLAVVVPAVRVVVALMLAVSVLVVAMRVIVLVSQVRLLVPERRHKRLAKSMTQQVAADKHAPGLFLRFVARNRPCALYQVKLDPLITARQRALCACKLSKNAS